MRPRPPTMPAAAIAIGLCGCGSDPPPSASGPATIVDTIGDTTIVRTLSGSVWGAGATLVPEVSIGELEGPEEYLFGVVGSLAADDDLNVYVLDTQAQHVRVFDSAGTYLRTLGGRGEGPGEFRFAEAVALLPDGRLIVRDPGNQCVVVFGSGGDRTGQWGYRAGNMYFGRSPLHTDAAGRTFLSTRDLSREGFRMQIVVLGPDGTPVDTLPEPAIDHDPPTLSAIGNSMIVSREVPFSPEYLWAIHRSGGFLTGFSAEYRIELQRDDGVLRIERAGDPVPVAEEERVAMRESVEGSMRSTQPDWSWDGPPIPRHKPFFYELVAGRDGRIWVRVATEAHPADNENHDPENPSSQAVVWREPLRYDVFEPDGTYLGAVAAPEGFEHDRAPVFDGDHVWAVTEDELGVERVVRYRIVVGDGRVGRSVAQASFALQGVSERTWNWQ